MTAQNILIVGKNGKTGHRVEALLQHAGYSTRGVSRSTTPSFDWASVNSNDTARWAKAMENCRAAYVTFQPDLAVPFAQEAIAVFLEQAKQAGIEHIVLLSGRGEEGAQQAEQLLINSGLRWNVVRASWFDQNFSEGILVDGIMSGTVALPAADVPEPFVDVDDIAEVAVACLTQPDLANQLFEVTGPELLTFRQCVAFIADRLQRPIEFVAITPQQMVEALRAEGMSEDELWLINELFTFVLDGRNSSTEDGVFKALGRPATSFAQYVEKTIAQGHWAV